MGYTNITLVYFTVMKTFCKPSDAIKWSKVKLLNHGYGVQTERWQGIPSPDDMWETMNLSFQMFIPHTLEELRDQVKPNLPWADDHFEERIGGQPLNPPPSNEWWPFNQKKNEEFKKDEKFSHTYPERLWPKYASDEPNSTMFGIRYNYGDFGDVIRLLQREPFTRQSTWTIKRGRKRRGAGQVLFLLNLLEDIRVVARN